MIWIENIHNPPSPLKYSDKQMTNKAKHLKNNILRYPDGSNFRDLMFIAKIFFYKHLPITFSTPRQSRILLSLSCVALLKIPPSKLPKIEVLAPDWQTTIAQWVHLKNCYTADYTHRQPLRAVFALTILSHRLPLLTTSSNYPSAYSHYRANLQCGNC